MLDDFFFFFASAIEIKKGAALHGGRFCQSPETPTVAAEGGTGAASIGRATLTTISPKSYGIKIEGGELYPMIRRGELLPFTHSVAFEPAGPGQRVATIEVYEGDGSDEANGRLLGAFDISGWVPDQNPRNVQIHVMMVLDTCGLLRIRGQWCKNRSFGAAKPLHVDIAKGAGSLTPAEIALFRDEERRVACCGGGD